MNRREIRRGLGNFAAITKSRLSGRTYVPHPRRAIFIETSGRCNLACRFCAYEKSKPGGFMSDERFANVLDQVCEMGYRFVWLTPMLGEVFADPKISEKFALLEADSRIEGYSFYSNFILARPAPIQALPGLRKLAGLYISLYGFDADTFARTTRKPGSQFEKLQENLSRLLALMDDWRPHNGIHFNVRTVRTDVPILERNAPMAGLLRELTAKGATVSEAEDYDSWGGTIAQSEVTPLGIELVDGNHLYMHGPCTKIFAEVQIKADGQVHACACRDMDGSLDIGHLDDAPLKEILSFANDPYRELIESQMRNKFGSNCRACSSYRSIYDGRPSHFDSSLEVMSYEQACNLLDN